MNKIDSTLRATLRQPAELIGRGLAPAAALADLERVAARYAVAVTPDELGAAFDGRKVHLPMLSQVNGKPFGRANAGIDAMRRVSRNESAATRRSSGVLK